MWLIRIVRRSAMSLAVIALIASIALNLSMLMVSGVHAAASAALSGIGVTTVAAREAGARLARRNATQKIGQKTARRVATRAQRGAVRSISSVGAEAIPVLGVAVLAGALALEVQDACATAADMAGLEAALLSEDDPDTARQKAVDAFDCAEMIREELPDLPDLSESYASGLDWIMGVACGGLPCDESKVAPE
ncbi:hypothetical protein ABIE58_001652 [Roseovarius sp. MBR-78]|uniref:hypothetical protein n=1 Tax=Roseovarius sp. MBR-78 TaxID=3156460 RepID=UPI003397F4E1